jgi:hypothetical protein
LAAQEGFKTANQAYLCPTIQTSPHLAEPVAIHPQQFYILGPFAKLRKATISFVMNVLLSVRPPDCMEQLVFHWTDFHEI